MILKILLMSGLRLILKTWVCRSTSPEYKVRPCITCGKEGIGTWEIELSISLTLMMDYDIKERSPEQGFCYAEII